MAPGLHKIFKRQAEDEEEVESTTLQLNNFRKHLHKVRITTPGPTTEAEGEL